MTQKVNINSRFPLKEDAEEYWSATAGKGQVTHVYDVLSHSPYWQGKLRFNEFTNEIEFTEGNPRHDPANVVERWFSEHGYAGQGLYQIIERQLTDVCKNNPYHPVKQYHASLDPWNDTQHNAVSFIADQFKSLRFRAGNLEAYVSRFLVSSKARIYEPGCQADMMLILEGPQGTGKSTILRWLFDPLDKGWYTDQLSSMSNKDGCQEMQGVLCACLDEMDTWNGHKKTTAKTFLTRRFDRFRPAYGRKVESFPRQCVIAGTINPDGLPYFDDTENRRYLCIAQDKKPSEKALTAFHENVQKMDAASLFLYQSGYQWHLTEEEERHQVQDTEERTNLDPWHNLISAHLQTTTQTDIATVATEALGMKTADVDRKVEMRIASVLVHKDNGWERKRVTENGKRVWKYVAPSAPTLFVEDGNLIRLKPKR